MFGFTHKEASCQIYEICILRIHCIPLTFSVLSVLMYFSGNVQAKYQFEVLYFYTEKEQENNRDSENEKVTVENEPFPK